MVLLCLDPERFIGPHRAIGLIYISGGALIGRTTAWGTWLVIGRNLLDEQGEVIGPTQRHYVIGLTYMGVLSDAKDFFRLALAYSENVSYNRGGARGQRRRRK